jgi:lipoyl(octanoyl) transferase
MRETVHICHLGHTPYDAAWAIQRRVQERLISAKRAGPAGGSPPLAMLVLEHPPVFTLGRNGDRANLLADAARLELRGATFVAVDRGGDITFHGPGQLVVYPILDLDRLAYPDGRRATDIHRYLRELEGAVIDTLAEYGLEGNAVSGRTGVWVGPDASGAERKICAMGVRCSRWVTMHGLAFNLNTDLSYFDLIVPCGISDRGVTSLAWELGHEVDEHAVASRFIRHFASRFGVELAEHRGPEALAFLEEELTLAVQPAP